MVKVPVSPEELQQTVWTIVKGQAAPNKPEAAIHRNLRVSREQESNRAARTLYCSYYGEGIVQARQTRGACQAFAGKAVERLFACPFRLWQVDSSCPNTAPSKKRPHSGLIANVTTSLSKLQRAGPNLYERHIQDKCSAGKAKRVGQMAQ